MHKNPKLMTDDVFGKVVESLKHVSIERLAPYLMCEPFSDPKLLDRIRLLKDNLAFKYLEISTNAALLTQSVIDNLKDALAGRAYRLIVSIQGASIQQHRDMMQVDPEKVWRNIAALANAGLAIDIQGCGSPQESNQTVFFTRDAFEQYVRDHVNSNLIFDQNIRYFEYNDRGGQIANTFSYKRNNPTCTRLWNWLHILHDGQITLCCNDYNRDYLFGHVWEYNKPQDYLKSAKFNTIKERLCAGDETLLCSKCSML